MNINEIILAKNRQSKLFHTNNFNLCRVPWDFLWSHMIGLADMLWQALDGILTSPTGEPKKQRVKVNFSSHSARIYYEHIKHTVQQSVNTCSWLKESNRLGHCAVTNYYYKLNKLLYIYLFIYFIFLTFGTPLLHCIIWINNAVQKLGSKSKKIKNKIKHFFSIEKLFLNDNK